MCLANRSSLEVSFYHLKAFKNILAEYLGDVPTPMLKIFDDVATSVTKEMFPSYGLINNNGQIKVRITDLPVIDTIRDLRFVVSQSVFSKKKCLLYFRMREKNVPFECVDKSKRSCHAEKRSFPATQICQI